MKKALKLEMRKWMRDLERATIKRDRSKIIDLLELNKERKYPWDELDQDDENDYIDFVYRAEFVIN